MEGKKGRIFEILLLLSLSLFPFTSSSLLSLLLVRFLSLYYMPHRLTQMRAYHPRS